MEYRILGPLEVTAGSARLDLGGSRQQVVLAALLIDAGRVVTTGRLLEAIYAENLPPTARSQAQIAISSLRRLFAVNGHPEIISTHPQGYILRVSAGELDAQRFEELVGAARQARDANQLELAVANYRDALRLWRGPALDGIDSQLVQASASHLDEQRVTVNEDRVQLELDMGRHGELVGELIELVEEFPVREPLRGHLMLALYRCGRTAEALEVYRRGRDAMIEELGIEPGRQLRRLEHAILNADPALDLPSRRAAARPAAQPQPSVPHPAQWQVPHLLPTDIADFTGRAKQIDEIRQLLMLAAGDPDRLAVPVIVIVGKGGVGKTSTAVHASHRVAGLFPDGQLFADLHGGGSGPVSPMQVLERFLRALGVPGVQLPDGLDERAEMYRNMLSGRRVLVVLDDAASEGQVLPLLPGSAAAAVIITSRSRLAGLPGASHVAVDVFDADKSLDLLARIAGAERVRAESEGAEAIARFCGHLPLALRIAGARLAARPHWSIQQLAERLEDEAHRLDELEHGSMDIRASISLSYESASDAVRRLFRRLALLDAPVFSGWVSAALLDIPLSRAEDQLDLLAREQLVETTEPGRGIYSQYRFHALIRVFARERLLAEEPEGSRNEALSRVLGALLHLTEEARRRQYGGDYVRLHTDAPRWQLPGRLVERLVADPLAWYDRERSTLVSGVRQAARAGLVELSWSLATSAVTLFESRVYLDDWRETHEVALAATRQAGDIRGEAAMRYSSGSLYMAEQRFAQARESFDRAAWLFAQIGDEQGTALVTRHLAFLDRIGGRLEDAMARYQQALAVFRRDGDHVAAAYVLHSMAKVRLERREVSAARELLDEALQLSRAAQGNRVESQVLCRIGEAHLMADELELASVAFESALARVRGIGDPVGEAYALHGIGLTRTRLRDLQQARTALHRARALAGAVGDRLAEARVLLALGQLALADGEPGEAAEFGRQAADSFGGLAAPLLQADAMELLSTAYAAAGDSAAASRCAAEALAIRAGVQGRPLPS